MDILAKQVNDFLKEEFALHFEFIEDNSCFKFSMDLKFVCLDIRIFCREEDKQVLLLAYVPIKIQDYQMEPVMRLINHIHMKNCDPICLFINEDCNQLMGQSVLNVGEDYRIDREVFKYAFCPLLGTLDRSVTELMRVLSATKDPEEDSSLDLAELISQAEKNDPEAQYQLALKYFEGDGVNPDHERAIDLLGSSLANGRQESKELLQAWISKFMDLLKETSDEQDYEEAAHIQTLIDRCTHWLKD